MGNSKEIKVVGEEGFVKPGMIADPTSLGVLQLTSTLLFT